MKGKREEYEFQSTQLIAVKSLAYLSEFDEHLNHFHSETGFDQKDISCLIDNPDFLGGVLDFIMQNESLLLAFSASEEIEPRQIQEAQNFFTRTYGDVSYRR